MALMCLFTGRCFLLPRSWFTQPVATPGSRLPPERHGCVCFYCMNVVTWSLRAADILQSSAFSFILFLGFAILKFRGRGLIIALLRGAGSLHRSEERRVGKECRSR